MNKIKVEDILKKRIPVLYEKVYSKDTRDRLKVAIKELIDAAIDKCWQKSRIRVKGAYDADINFEAEDTNMLRLNDNLVITSVDKESILKVKELFDYN